MHRNQQERGKTEGDLMNRMDQAEVKECRGTTIEWLGGGRVREGDVK